MGRIIAPVKIENALDPTKSIRIDALVDPGASNLVLPKAWRDRLGKLETLETVDREIATQEIVRGEVCGPVKIQIEGFRPIFSEVLFLEMQPGNGGYEPLIGYIILEQSQAAIDMVGHRLLHVKHLDLK